MEASSIRTLRDVFWGDLTQKLVFVVFVALNLLLMLFSVPDGPYVAAADVGVSIEPVRGLLAGEGFTHPDGQLYTWGTPLFPMFLAVLLGLLPWKAALYSIVVVQCALLYAIGLFTRRLADFYSPKVATLAQSLVVFNPNLLITSHLLQTEIIFTFFLTAGVVALLSFRDSPTWSRAALVGLLFGLATLVRPVRQFVVLLLPLLFVLLGEWKERRLRSRNLAAGFTAAVIALLTISPWVVRNQVMFGTPFLTANAGWYLEDQYRQLLHNGHGMSNADTKAQAEARVMEKLPGLKMNREELGSMPRNEQSRILSSIYLDAILDVEVAVHPKAIVMSLLELYFSGGASNFRNYLGIDGKQAVVQYQGESRSGLFDPVSRLFSQIGFGYAFLLAVTLSFAIVMRVAGIVGLIGSLRSEKFSPVWIYLAIMGVLTLSYLYLGQSRFRIPLEPYLAVLAATGIAMLRDRFGNSG